MSRYELTEFEWKTIQPLLPNRPHGVPRIDDRRILNGFSGFCGPARPGRTCPSAP